MKQVLFSFVICLCLPLVATATGPHYDAPACTNSVDGDFDITGNIAFDCNTCPCLIYQEAETTDAHGCGITEHAGHAFGTSKDGGDLTLCGGDASHSIATTAAIAAGDTVTTSIDGTALAALTEGVDFDCSGTDDTCAASLCSAINAQSGVSCSGSTSPINPQVDADKCGVSFAFADGAADGVVGVDTTGSVGVVLLAGASLGSKTIRLGFSNGAGLAPYTTTGIGFINSLGQRVFSYSTGGLTVNGGTINLNTGELVDLAGPTQIGAVGSTSHSLGVGDVIVDNSLEVDGDLYADGDIIQSTAKGAATTQLLNVDSVTFDANPGNASKTTSGLCPANSIVHGITYRVPTAATNCASVEIGDGADVDMFGTAQAITQGTTGDISDYTDQTTRVNVYTAAGFEATVTANGGNCFDGVWRFTCHYTQLTADTAN
jgi:hypothetical protein